MFLTPKQRYDRYWTWCLLLGVRPASFETWQQQAAKVPERLPIAWRTSSSEQFA